MENSVREKLPDTFIFNCGKEKDRYKHDLIDLYSPFCLLLRFEVVLHATSKACHVFFSFFFF